MAGGGARFNPHDLRAMYVSKALDKDARRVGGMASTKGYDDRRGGDGCQLGDPYAGRPGVPVCRGTVARLKVASPHGAR